MTDTAKLDAMLRKVQALLARADHPNTPPAEADTARSMAEALMAKYRIDEQQLIDSGGITQGIVPVWRDINLCQYGSPFSQNYVTIFAWIAEHLDIRFVYKYTTNGYVATACGYDTDLRIAEMLHTECSLQFGKKLEPKYDPELSNQVNAYLMRSAGMEGKRIAMAIFGKCDKGDPPKVRKMFKKEAEARGENPAALLGQGNDMKLYRKSYAQGFTDTLWRRLSQMRMERAADGALVLRSRKDAVDEAFYTKFPQYRPRAVGVIGETATSAPCPKCAKAKSGTCRDHSYRRYTPPKMNYNAYGRGEQAANQVNLKG